MESSKNDPVGSREAALGPLHSLRSYQSWASTARALLEPAWMDAYLALARALPVQGASYYAELRLAEPQQLDLLLSLDCYCSPNVASQIAERRLGRGPEAAWAWERALGILRRWTSPDSDLRGTISTIWLEFDDVRTPLDDVAPSLSACLIGGYRADPAALPRTSAPAEVASVTSAYRALAGDAWDVHSHHLLDWCARALPSGGRIIHLSLMAAREPKSVKLYIVLPREELRAYLTRVDFCGPHALVEEALAQLMPADLTGDHLYVDLNLANMHDAGLATLGLAFTPQQLLLDPGRERTLHGLVRAGQCDEAAAEALRAWQRGDQKRGGEPWLDLKTVVGGARRSIATKAYLGMGVTGGPWARGGS